MVLEFSHGCCWRWRWRGVLANELCVLPRVNVGWSSSHSKQQSSDGGTDSLKSHFPIFYFRRVNYCDSMTLLTSSLKYYSIPESLEGPGQSRKYTGKRLLTVNWQEGAKE